MLYFYQQGYEAEQAANEALINKLKDNFHKHPKSGFIHDLIADLPQKSFADVMVALGRLANNFELKLQQTKSPAQANAWMHNLLAEVDEHNVQFGLDPQQTGNLIRYTLRGMIYHHFIENGEYLIPTRHVKPLAFINNETLEHSVFQHSWLKNKAKKPMPLANNLKLTLCGLFKQLMSAYRQGLLACGLLLEEQHTDLLVNELSYFKSSTKLTNTPALAPIGSDSWLETINTIKQLTLFSDVYWNIGALYGLRAFLIRLNSIGQFIPSEQSDLTNPIAALVTEKVATDEEIAVVYNASNRVLSLVQQTLEQLEPH